MSRAARAACLEICGPDREPGAGHEPRCPFYRRTSGPSGPKGREVTPRRQVPQPTHRALHELGELLNVPWQEAPAAICAALRGDYATLKHLLLALEKRS